MDFGYFKENYKLIATDLSKQTKLKDPRQINFIGKIENQDHVATMFFLIEKSEEAKETKFCRYHINNGNTKNYKFAKWF